MKKTLLTIALMAALIQLVNAQWTTSGNNIYNTNTGFVGIGTSSPTSYLHVSGTGSNSSLSLQNTMAAFYTQMAFAATGKTFNIGVGNASETYFGVPNTFFIYDATSNAMRFIINSAGNVGINTVTPVATFDVNGMAAFGIGNGNGKISVTDAIGFNRNAVNGAIFNSAGYGYQLGHTLSTTPAADQLAFSVWSPTGGYLAQNVLTLTGQALVGVKSDAPYSFFQVDDGVSKASLGSAGDAGTSSMGYGTSYLGFNAARYYSGSSSNQSWQIDTDGSNNGAGVIWGTVNGNIYFAPVATTGNAARTLTDAQIASSVMMRVTPTAVYAKQIYVQTGIFPDYVFKKNYRLRSLADVKTYIDQNHHLPEIPSAETVEKDGLNLGEINKLLTKKVEELTLYAIKQQQEIDNLKTGQQEQINQLKKQLNKLSKSAAH